MLTPPIIAPRYGSVLKPSCPSLWTALLNVQGFKAIRAGLIADTYLEAMNVYKHKKSYDEFVFTYVQPHLPCRVLLKRSE